MRALSTLATLVASLALAGCGNHLSTGVSVDPALSKFVASDTVVLAAVDLDKIRAAPFYVRHQKQLDVPIVNNFAGQSGFDFRRDLDSVLLTWNGKNLVIAGRGRFDIDKIQRQLAASAIRAEYKKHALFEYRGDAVTFIDKEVAVGGNTHSVEGAIDLASDGTGGVPGELAAPLAKLSKADQIWLVSRGGLPFADMPASSEWTSILSNFAGYTKTTSAGITLDTGIHFKAEIDCVSDAGAKRLDDGVRGGLGFARLAIKNNQLDLLPLYDAVHVKQDNQTVYVQADLSPELADKLLDRFVNGGIGLSSGSGPPH